MNMYFIAIVCPEEIHQQVLKWKLWMKEKYDCEAALRSPAHITIVPPFWMKPELEENLKRSISDFSSAQDCFVIQLNNFSCFKPRVIFVDVISNNNLSGLKEDLFKQLVSEDKYPIEKDERPFSPHVTIATRDLHKKSFYESWEHFKEKKYKAEWKADRLSLLGHNKKNWDVTASFEFKQDSSQHT